MIWRVRDILPVIAEHLRGTGVDIFCDAKGTREAMDAYNRINEILMNRHDWPGTEADVCFTAHRGCITLPERFETIKALRIDGRPGRILSQGFEYLEAGPGILDYSTPIEALQFLGNHFPTYRDLPQCLPVGCFSDEPEDVGKKLQIHGLDADKRQRMIEIPIVQGKPDQSPWTTSDSLCSIAAIAKPITKGHIEIFGYNRYGPTLYWLSRLAPLETAPALSRYFLSGCSCDGEFEVRARVSIRYAMLYSLDDVSLIQHREAYRLMAQAITAFDDNNGALGSEYQNRAVKLLKERVAKLRDGQRQAINVTMARTPTRRGWRYTLR